MAYNKETGMYEGFIYKITNLIDGKIYIGQTIRDIETRWKQHISDAKRDDFYLYRAIRKYGVSSFKIECICIISCAEKNILDDLLDKSEICYIELYDSNNRICGYNITSGGQNAPTNVRPIDQCTVDGELINEWDSIASASRYYGIPYRSIFNCVNGKTLSCRGCIWRYHGESYNKYRTNKLDNSGWFKYKKVVCLDDCSQVVAIYDSISIAADAVGLKNPYNITLVCSGKRKHAAGYKWMYYNDYIKEYGNEEVKYA